jgi:hypothetical protein
MSENYWLSCDHCVASPQTVEGWPTFQDIMTMVRVTYVLAATQASIAFDKLSKDGEYEDHLLSSLKEKVMQVACLPFLRRAALVVSIILKIYTEVHSCTAFTHSVCQFLSVETDRGAYTLQQASRELPKVWDRGLRTVSS